MGTTDGATVTVVVPTHDRPMLLSRALASIGYQTYQPIEVIVVDDGSSVPVEVTDMGSVRVKVVRHPTRLGPGAARNTGIAHASGKFVAFLDDDDELTRRRIATAVLGIDQHRMHACATSDNSTPYTGDRRNDLLHGPTPHVSQVLFRREDLVQFDPTLRLGEDVEWWIRMADRAEFAWSDGIGVIINHHEGARPDVFHLTHAECREWILRRHWSELDREARIRQLARVASLNLVAGRFGLAARFAIRSLFIRPTRRAFATVARSVTRRSG